MELQEPKLPEFYSPGRVFLSAFAAGAAINARRTQLENQLQHLQLQNEAMQYRQQQQEATFGLRERALEIQNDLGLARIQNVRDRMEIDRDRADSMNAVKEAAQALNEQKFAFEKSKTMDELSQKEQDFYQKRVGSFNKQMEHYKLPPDAFDGGVQWDKQSDGRYKADIYIKDKMGAQQYHQEGTKVTPIKETRFIDAQTYDWLTGESKDLKTSKPTPRMVDPGTTNPPQDKYIPGKTYKDAGGNSAVYLGNGQWQAQ